MTSSSHDPVINEEADRVLGRILIRYGIVFIILSLAGPFALAFTNIPGSRLFAYHRWIDYASVLIMMTPFFLGVARVSAERLKFGRRYIQEQRYSETAAVLESFTQFGQRFLDRSGEAHYLLSQAYQKLGLSAKSKKARDFVIKHRPGTRWAGLAASEIIAPPSARTVKTRPSESGAQASTDGKARRATVRPPKKRY